MTATLETKNTLDLAAGVWGTWMFYGATGSGKTTLGSSFPRPLFIVPRTEGSQETLRGLDFPYMEVSSDPKAELVDGCGSMDKILNRLELVYKSAPNKFPYDTIVFESITHWQDILINGLTQNGVLIMDQSKWGLLANQIMALHTRIKNLDVHVVYTALDKSEKLDDNTMFGGPLLSGQVAMKLPSACTVIGYCELYSGKQHRVHFKKYRHYQARSRYRKMPDKVEGPFDDFYSRIEEFLEP